MEYKELTFGEALNEVLAGRRVTKLGWNDKRSYILMEDDMLMLQKAGELTGKLHVLIVSRADMEGLDWVVLSEAN